MLSRWIFYLQCAHNSWRWKLLSTITQPWNIRLCRVVWKKCLFLWIWGPQFIKKVWKTFNNVIMHPGSIQYFLNSCWIWCKTHIPFSVSIKGANFCFFFCPCVCQLMKGISDHIDIKIWLAWLPSSLRYTCLGTSLPTTDVYRSVR